MTQTISPTSSPLAGQTTIDTSTQAAPTYELATPALTDASANLAATTTPVPATHPALRPRPRVRGKFIFVGEEKLYIRGITYGPFRPQSDGCEYHTPEQVDHDFAQMASLGLNCVRVYTVPPRWLLDIALKYNLYVMVGMPWEQHISFLDERARMQDIERRVRQGVRQCANHPAVLFYAIGNEIPASMVRWYGHPRVEKFLHRLYRAVKEEDPLSIVTYVNYPTTEYLHLEFVDVVSFNVYLETQDKLSNYLLRLQNIAGDRPLIMAEIGLDSIRNGDEKQSSVLDWQIRTAFACGIAGLFVFSWTDEWFRGGHDILDWGFGLTTRERAPKPALTTVAKAFADTPFPRDFAWPKVSVLVCTYNGSRTLRDCCEGLQQLVYPNYEVIVVNDGSKDNSAQIAQSFGYKVITTPNRGLSNARNTALEHATGDIVAYTDDDARPDPHWLMYLVNTFLTTQHAGVGGPNIAPGGDGESADCVANAPGGPTHVLLTDREAEHIPGCNMAFWRKQLQAIGGFDANFRIAGDDVDACWRLQQQGWTLGFSPAAMVWHHRRNSIRAYLRQQKNYGKAEALLEIKWPDKYNSLGHLTWKGRLYGSGFTRVLPFQRWRVYHGVWGSNLFQSLYAPTPDLMWSLPLMPEWYLIVLVLLGITAFGVIWLPLLWALPLLVIVAGIPISQAIWSAAHADFTTPIRSRWHALHLYTTTALLHMLQPMARLMGRITFGLTPWRRRAATSYMSPWPRTTNLWHEHWKAPEDRLATLESVLRYGGAVVLRGGDFDRWDLEIRGGLFGAVRTRMAIEEHGSGKQQVRFRAWPVCSTLALGITITFTLLALLAFAFTQFTAGCVLSLVAIPLLYRNYSDCSAAMATLHAALDHPRVANGA